MTLDEFIASRVETADVAASVGFPGITGHNGADVFPGHVYAGHYWIETLPDGQCYLLVERDEYVGTRETLEPILYQYANE